MYDHNLVASVGCSRHDADVAFIHCRQVAWSWPLQIAVFGDCVRNACKYNRTNQIHKMEDSVIEERYGILKDGHRWKVVHHVSGAGQHVIRSGLPLAQAIEDSARRNALLDSKLQQK